MPKVSQENGNAQKKSFKMNTNKGFKVPLLVKLMLSTKIRGAIIVIVMIIMKYQH